MGTGGVGVGGRKGQRIKLASCGSRLYLDLERLIVVVVGGVALEFYVLVLIYLLRIMIVIASLYFETLVCDLIA